VPDILDRQINVLGYRKYFSYILLIFPRSIPSQSRAGDLQMRTIWCSFWMTPPASWPQLQWLQFLLFFLPALADLAAFCCSAVNRLDGAVTLCVLLPRPVQYFTRVTSPANFRQCRCCCSPYSIHIYPDFHSHSDPDPTSPLCVIAGSAFHGCLYRYSPHEQKKNKTKHPHTYALPIV